MTTILLLILASVGGVCCYMVGWQIGRRHGRDEEWVANVLEQGRREAARHDAQGRFRSPDEPKHPSGKN